MSTPGTVFWDFDGTLVARPSMWAHAAARAVAELAPHRRISSDDLGPLLTTGFPWHRPEVPHPELCEPEAWWARVTDRIASELCTLGCTQTEAQTVALRVRAYIVDATGYAVFVDVEPALRRLAAAGWTQAVVSNQIPELAQLVTDLGLAPYFVGVYTSAIVGYEKPNAGFLGSVLDDGPWPAPIWVVGDSVEADCLPARALGYRAILVRTPDVSFQPCVADLGQTAALIMASERVQESRK